MSNYWSPLDEELAEKVMGWKIVSLSEPEWKDHWPSWPRETRMRLAWYAEDPEDACCWLEVAPGTGKDGRWKPTWIPRLSTDMNEAMRLCEGIRAKHGRLELRDSPDGTWRAAIEANGSGIVIVKDDSSPAMAIAKAALAFALLR